MTGRGRPKVTATAITLGLAWLAVACAPPTQARWDGTGLKIGQVISVGQSVRVPDVLKGHDLTLRSDSTAAVGVVAGAPGQGVALAFPSKGYTALTAADASGLSPHDKTFEVSAWVSVTGGQISPLGSNLVQQGTYYGDEWKLEVDDGRAGCRFSDGDVHKGAHAAAVRSAVHVDDGAWWILTCRKRADKVAVVAERVGGPGPQVTEVSSQVGSIDSTEPVIVGSKGIPTDADQFRGRIDNVEVRFG